MPHKNKINSPSAPLKAIVGAQELRALLNSVSARTRIAIGQISILIGVLLLAMTLGLIPSASAAAREHRSQICETIAICGSAFVERGDLNAFESSLRSIQSHNPDILSAGVRRNDGKLLIDVGEHERNWPKLGQTVHGDSLAYVGMYNGNSRWGTIEIRFRPLSAGGWAGFLLNQQAGLLLFVSSACAGLFLFYLRKMLQHLDPSKVVPPRVRSALDTLAEGCWWLTATGGSCWPTRLSPRSSAARPTNCSGLVPRSCPGLNDADPGSSSRGSQGDAG